MKVTIDSLITDTGCTADVDLYVLELDSMWNVVDTLYKGAYTGSTTDITLPGGTGNEKYGIALINKTNCGVYGYGLKLNVYALVTTIVRECNYQCTDPRNPCPGGYRFGFNGQEKDNEVYGEGNSYTAEYWQYDPRLGRRWNVDPKPEPDISYYATFANNPIVNTDPDGDKVKYGHDGISSERRREIRRQVKARLKSGDTDFIAKFKEFNKIGNKNVLTFLDQTQKFDGKEIEAASIWDAEHFEKGGEQEDDRVREYYIWDSGKEPNVNFNKKAGIQGVGVPYWSDAAEIAPIVKTPVSPTDDNTSDIARWLTSKSGAVLVIKSYNFRVAKDETAYGFDWEVGATGQRQNSIRAARYLKWAILKNPIIRGLGYSSRIKIKTAIADNQRLELHKESMTIK